DAYTESMLVKRGYLEHFFTDIETKYGSIDEFLSNELDVDIDAMREHYLVGEGLPSSVVYTDEHHIELIGEDNFRDLGGYVGADNKRVLEGKLFRSGELSGLTEGDKQILTDLGIEQLVDLRTKGEMLDKPDNIPDTIDVYHLPLVPEAENDNSSAVQVNLVDQWVNNLRDPNFDNEAEMISAYNYIDEQRIANWTEIFDLLESNKTTLWHCTGGQDRVGMTTALVLSSLGVSRDVIIKDYLATNEYLAEYGEQMARYMATMYNDETLYQTILDNMGARETYINAFFDVVESEYGDMDTFLQVLGVDIELMQQNYLIK
ncbi:MAG: tyrosine-protein phosphatase, partial [Pseudomonadota bacterium]